MAQTQVLYVGTSDGIAILSNPGHTDRWLTADRELLTHTITALACASDTPMNAAAQTEHGMYITTDGGRSWKPDSTAPALPTPSQTLTLAGQPAAVLRLAVNASSLERSADEGATWQRVAIDTTGTMTVLHAPAYHPDTAFLGTANGEVWRSSDRGRTWTRIKRDLPAVTAFAIGRIIS